MSELQVFKNDQFGEIRTVMRVGEPWFVAADVCGVLGHRNVSVSLARIDEDEKAKFNLGLRKLKRPPAGSSRWQPSDANKRNGKDVRL